MFALGAAVGTVWMAVESHNLARISLYEPKIEIMEAKLEQIDQEEVYDPTRDAAAWSDLDISSEHYEAKKKLIFILANNGKLAAVSVSGNPSCFVRIETGSSLGLYAIKLSSSVYKSDWLLRKDVYDKKNLYEIQLNKTFFPNNILEIYCIYYYKNKARPQLTDYNIGKYFKVITWSPMSRFSSPDWFPKKRGKDD